MASRSVAYGVHMTTSGGAPRRPLRRDAERNRQRILDAARTLVAQGGLGISHDEIATAADVAVGTVYRRFPDKESLVEALYSERLDEVVAAAEAARDLPDPWQALVTFMTDTLEHQADNRGLGELAFGTARAMKLSTQARERVAPVVEDIVQRARAAGVVRAGVGAADLAFVPMMVGAVLESARGIDDQLWRRMLVLVLDGFRSGQTSPLPGSQPTGDTFDAVMSSPRPQRH
jgi:AcrR family transcriptional regulator